MPFVIKWKIILQLNRNVLPIAELLFLLTFFFGKYEFQSGETFLNNFFFLNHNFLRDRNKFDITYIHTYIHKHTTNVTRDRGSIPGPVIPKTQKLVLDTALLNTQH